MPYIHSLTPLRGIAAMMVAILHFSDDLFPLIDTTAVTMLIKKGYLWVDFFFVLSGFIITYVYGHWFSAGCSGRTYWRFMYARFSKIYPIHFAVLLGFVAIEFIKLWFQLNTNEALLSAPFSGDRHPFGILTTALLIHSLGIHSSVVWNFPSWSMSVEWATYMLYPALAFIFLRLDRKHVAFALFALFALDFWFAYSHGHLNVFADYGIVRCLLEFSCGMLVYRLFEHGDFAAFFKRSEIFVIASLGALTIMHFAWFDALTIPCFCLIILTAAHNDGAVRRALNIRPLVFIGDISYSLYMTHFFVREFGSRIWRTVTGVNVWDMKFTYAESLIAMSISLMVVILVAWISYRLIELPCQRALRYATFAPKDK
jgi:peptidoglycan/LPS O-acetylase OafA/YrhL